jgi:hypothetical protein
VRVDGRQPTSYDRTFHVTSINTPSSVLIEVKYESDLYGER